MSLRKIIGIYYILILLVACQSPNKANEVVEDNNIDTTINHDLEFSIQKDSTKKAHEVTEFKENLKVIEQKYGQQWGFCECVTVNDSIDKAVKALSDFDSKHAELLLERFEYVSDKCQAFIGMDANRTPEQRDEHQKKVKKCLKNAKSS